MSKICPENNGRESGDQSIFAAITPSKHSTSSIALRQIVDLPFKRYEWIQVCWEGKKDGKLQNALPALCAVVLLMEHHKIRNGRLLFQAAAAEEPK